jgi:cyclic dehypoxanthinyl futalosine synthase
MGISREQALDCFQSDDLVGIGMEAEAVRRRLHPEGVVSYAIGGVVDCSGGAGDAGLDTIFAAIGEIVECDGTGVQLRCGNVSSDGLARCERLFREVRRRFPQIWIEGLSAAEVTTVARACGLEPRETIVRLQDAGMDTIAGGGVDLVHGTQEWFATHHTAHALGMRTVAVMTFGAGETAEQRVDLMEAVRVLQAEMGGFSAFVPVAANAPGGRELDGVTAVERLKTLAIGRMFLDNIENVEMDSSRQGLKVLQMGLGFGANDLGLVEPGGSNEEDVRRIIRDAGFKPAQRDAAYRAMFVS